MADLYSVISGIEPDQQDILEAELLAQQILSARFPDMDLREGTGVRDLVLRPSAFILALCRKGMDYYFSQRSLSGIDDTSDPQIVDGILGNLFLTRNTGTYAVVNARLYFSRQKSVTIPSGTSFSTDGSILFYPASTVVLPDNSLSYDSFQNEWYVDIDLTAAATGSSYNLSSGSLLYFSNFEPQFLHAEINYLAQSSTASETNSEFIARASNAISTRNLINNPSITSNLQQNFNYLDRIENVGFGDMDMYRDQVKIRGKSGLLKTATGAGLVLGGSEIQAHLPSHGYVLNQLLDVDAFELRDVGLGTILVEEQIPQCVVSSVIDGDNFVVSIGRAIAAMALVRVNFISVDPDMYIHTGGCVDIYCGNEVSTTQETFTADTNGRITVPGASYSWARVNGAGDTIPLISTFSKTFEGSVARFVTLSQNGAGVIVCSAPSHCLIEGRTVKIQGWPTSVETHLWRVSNVVDGNTFELGTKPSLTIGTGLTPLMYFVDPYVDTGFTPYQNMYLDFGPGQAGHIATFNIGRFNKVDAVQSYLTDPNNRVLCGDYRARGFDLYIVNVTLTTYAALTPSTAVLSSIIAEYLKGLAAGQSLVVSDMVALLIERGNSSFQLPVNVSVDYHYKDLFDPITIPVTDSLTPASNTCVFLVGDVSVTRSSLPVAQ